MENYKCSSKLNEIIKKGKLGRLFSEYYFSIPDGREYNTQNNYIIQVTSLKGETIEYARINQESGVVVAMGWSQLKELDKYMTNKEASRKLLEMVTVEAKSMRGVK